MLRTLLKIHYFIIP